MKKFYNRTLALFFSFVMMMSGLGTQTLFAQDEIISNNYHKINDYSNHIYDGIKEVYLGYLKVENNDSSSNNSDGISLHSDYREYDTFKIYNQGIVTEWNWLSNPHFIISIAKGMQYEKSTTITSTINASISGNYPYQAKTAILNAFNIEASGSKTISTKVTFSGPTGNKSSRDFYYQNGTHRYKVRIIQEHRSNWDGVLWTKEYYVYVDVPAIKHYSVDR